MGTIRIDPDLIPTAGPGGKKSKTAIEVVVREGGVFEVEGKVLDQEALQAALKVAAKEGGEGGVLMIKAEKKGEFKYVQRIIKAGAAAGLRQVAYGLLIEEKEEEKEEEIKERE